MGEKLQGGKDFVYGGTNELLLTHSRCRKNLKSYKKKIRRIAVLFTKYSIVKCPVCGQAGKNLKDVEEDEKIGCRKCGSKTRAARWTE